MLLNEVSAYDAPFDQGGGDDDQYPNGPNPGPNLAPPTPAPPAGGGFGALPPELFNFIQSNAGGGRGGGGGGGGYGIGNDFPDFSFGKAPKFVAPEFSLPSFQDAQNEPGYQFRLKAGSDALERSAAAKGLLRTGGTLKDLAQWNQDFAAQEYQNVANRALQSFDRRYQGAKDTYAPLLAEWSMLSNANLQKALAQYARGTVWNNPHAGGGGGGGGGVYDPEPVFG